MSAEVCGGTARKAVTPTATISATQRKRGQRMRSTTRLERAAASARPETTSSSTTARTEKHDDAGVRRGDRPEPLEAREAKTRMTGRVALHVGIPSLVEPSLCYVQRSGGTYCSWVTHISSPARPARATSVRRRRLAASAEARSATSFERRRSARGPPSCWDALRSMPSALEPSASRRQPARRPPPRSQSRGTEACPPCPPCVTQVPR